MPKGKDISCNPVAEHRQESMDSPDFAYEIEVGDPRVGLR